MRRWRIKRADRAGINVEVGQVCEESGDPYGLCRDDYGDGLERVALRYNGQVSPYFTIPREDVEALPLEVEAGAIEPDRIAADVIEQDKPVDYRALLGKYMELVGTMDGVDFIDLDDPTPPNWVNGVTFSDAEWRELQRIAAEGRKPFSL